MPAFTPAFTPATMPATPSGPLSRSRVLTVLVVVALVALALYGVVIALVWWGQERLLFHPDKLPAGYTFQQAADVHESWVDVPGARLNALHLQLPKPDGVVFFLHGNAGSLETWFINADFYRRANLDLYMIDFRGYGKSSGRIESEAQLQADVRAAWAQVAPRYAGQRRVIYGRSLGTALAAQLAAEVQPELTVLVSPYASMAALAQKYYPWVPSAVMRYPLRTDEALAKVKGPVLLAHGGNDTLIAPANSLALQQVAPHAQLLLVPQAGHGDMQLFDAYLNGLRALLANPQTRLASPAQ